LASLLRAESITTYDAQGRVSGSSQYSVDQTTGAVGSAHLDNSTLYDARGMTAETDLYDVKLDGTALNTQTTSYVYDSVRRQAKVIQNDLITDGSDGNANTADYSKLVTKTSYDAAGNVLTTTDAKGNVTTNAYDAANRQTTVTGADPDGSGALSAPVMSYTYNAAGEVASVTDPVKTTSYTYDALGRQLTVSVPDSSRITPAGITCNGDPAPANTGKKRRIALFRRRASCATARATWCWRLCPNKGRGRTSDIFGEPSTKPRRSCIWRLWQRMPVTIPRRRMSTAEANAAFAP